MARSIRPLMGSTPAAPFVAALAGVALATITLLATPRAAEARCAEPAPIEEAVRTADLVMVGTVSAVAEEGTRATVHVEEIWRGPGIPVEVVVFGGPGGRTSVDRTFVAGTRYLFTITLGPDGRLTDSQCSSTLEWDAKLRALRPADARLPVAANADAAAGANAAVDPSSLAVPAGVALLAAAALLIAGLLARGRQHR